MGSKISAHVLFFLCSNFIYKIYFLLLIFYFLWYSHLLFIPTLLILIDFSHLYYLFCIKVFVNKLGFLFPIVSFLNLRFFNLILQIWHYFILKAALIVFYFRLLNTLFIHLISIFLGFYFPWCLKDKFYLFGIFIWYLLFIKVIDFFLLALRSIFTFASNTLLFLHHFLITN